MIVRLLLPCLAILNSTIAWADEPLIPVTVQTKTEAIFREGMPLLVTLIISNGFDAPIHFTTFSLKPTEWNGETMNVGVGDVYRDGQKKNLYIRRPRIESPPAVQGPGSEKIPPKGKLAVMIDLSKWTIAGGWIKGRYEVEVFVKNGDRQQASA